MEIGYDDIDTAIEVIMQMFHYNDKGTDFKVRQILKIISDYDRHMLSNIIKYFAENRGNK